MSNAILNGLRGSLLGIGLLVLAVIAVADTAQTTREDSAVTISDEVKQQLQKLSPNERKRIEAAISVGNKYVPHHFDGTAYARNDEQQEELWQKSIRPLVVLQADKGNGGWYYPGEVFTDSAPKLEINGMRVRWYVVCPKPELVSASVANGHFELMYRTKIIGMWRSATLKWGPTLADFIQDEFIMDKKNEDDEVLITVDKSNRVSRVDAKYEQETSVPVQHIRRYEAYIKFPPQKLYQGAEHVEEETEEQARARIPQYKKYIELIKSVEAAACGGASDNSN